MDENTLLNDIKKEISDNKKIRVAINGFGRIGRMIFRAGINNPNIEFVAINDLSDPEALKYFLKFDSAHGKFDKEVRVEGDYLMIGEKKVRITAIRELENLPWKEMNIDVVAECTGFFTDTEKAREHITKAGAKKVLISAPGKGDCFYYVRGVNDSDYTGQEIVSNGSCTTNSITAVINEINNKYKIKKGLFSTVHSVTGDQRILDAVHKKLRRGRAAPFNIVPTTTGAAKSVIKLIPELEGKLHGVAYRVPTITGSISDLNLELEKDVTEEEINSFLKELSKGKLFGILDYTEEEYVSSDIIGNYHSGIVDAKTTKVVGGNMVKLAVWYDNEWGFSNRMVEVIERMGNYNR